MKFRDLDDELFTAPMEVEDRQVIEIEVDDEAPARMPRRGSSMWGLAGLGALSLAFLVGMSAVGTAEDSQDGPAEPVRHAKESPAVIERFESGFEPAPAEIVDEAGAVEQESGAHGKGRLVGEMKMQKLR